MHAEVGVALVGAHHHGAGLGDGEIRTRHAGIGAQEAGPRGAALALGQVVHVAVVWVGAQRAREDLGHVGAQLVHRRHHDVAGRLVVELLDAFTEVGLDDLDASLLEEGPHLAFVGEHRLALDQRLGAACGHDVVHDLVVLGGVACPVHGGTVGLRLALELLQVVGQVGEGVLLDLRGQRAQLLPFGNRRGGAVAFGAQVPQAAVVEFDVVAGGDEFRRRLGMVDRLVHSRTPFSTCAMCRNLTGSSSRSAQPFWCIRQDMSAETMYSAPAPWWSCTLS